MFTKLLKYLFYSSLKIEHTNIHECFLILSMRKKWKFSVEIFQLSHHIKKTSSFNLVTLQ